MYHIFIGYMFTGCFYGLFIVELAKNPQNEAGSAFLDKVRKNAVTQILFVLMVITLWVPLCLRTLRTRFIGSAAAIMTGGILTYIFSEISRFFH